MRTFAAVLLASCLVPCAAQSRAQLNQACAVPRTISVTATGTATEDADLAIVHVGYRVFGADAKSAYATASDTSNAIMKALTDGGVLKDAIESTGQAVGATAGYELGQYPMYSEQRHDHQFTVVQGWTVSVKPGEAAKVLNTAVLAGANESGWIEWRVSDEGALDARASAEAAANAWVEADQLAEKLKVHITNVENVNQFAGFAGGMGSGQEYAMTQAVRLSTNGNQPLAIQSRRIEVRATLQATFAIE